MKATSAKGDRESLMVKPSADLLAEVPKHPLFQQAVRAEVERLLQKEFFPMLVEKMKGYFDKEKAERAAIAREAEKTANNASEMRQDLDSLKGAISRSIHSLVGQAAQQGTELGSQQERLNAAEFNIEAAKTNAKTGIEELALQLPRRQVVAKQLQHQAALPRYRSTYQRDGFDRGGEPAETADCEGRGRRGSPRGGRE